MDPRWWVFLWTGAFVVWAALCYDGWRRGRAQESSENFSTGAAPPPPTCRFVGTDHPNGGCPARYPQKMATLGDAGSQLKCQNVEVGAMIPGGSQARARAVIDAHRVKQVIVMDTGAKYMTPPEVKVLGGVGTGAEFKARIANGRVIAIDVVKPGYGYITEPHLQIEPPRPTYAYCNLCCERNPLEKSFQDLKDRYETLERILLEADTEVKKVATGEQENEAEKPLPEELIRRREDATAFRMLLSDYLKEQRDDVGKAQELLKAIRRQQEKEKPLRELAEKNGFDVFKPQYDDAYVDSIEWIAKTDERIREFLNKASEVEMASCHQRWQKYSKKPSNTRPFEESCAAFVPKQGEEEVDGV